MQEESIMSYKELCDFFQEEKANKGKSRQLQFDRWRQEYNIDKIEGKNKYIVSKKNYVEMTKVNNKKKNMNFSTLLSPIIYTTLMNAESDTIALSSLEQQRAFALINSTFGLKAMYQNAIADNIGVKSSDLSAFKEAIWKINAQTIKNVTNSMVKKRILTIRKGFKCQDLITGKWFIADGEYFNEIFKRINKVSMDKYGLLYYKINDKTKKREIKEEVSRHFGFETFYSSDIYVLDKESIKIEYETEIKKDLESLLLSEDSIQSNLIEINTNNCLKISKSRNKNLANISKYDKEKMISALISETEERCKKNYDNIIKTAGEMKTYYNLPIDKSHKL